MVSDNTLWGVTIWVIIGVITSIVGNFVAEIVAEVGIVGELLFAAVWLVAHLYAIKFVLAGVAVLVEDIVSAELDRREG